MNAWKISTIVFATLFAATIATDRVGTAEAEKQPHMKVALAHLEKATNQLEKATPDKGGHRVKAIELAKQAIEQVKKGIAFDNRK